VIPDISVNGEGSTIFNDTTREVLLNPLQDVNKNDIPLLGMTLLTSAYLNVNYDTGSFSLWQATPTTDQKLVGVGKSSSGCRIVSNGTSSTSESSSPSNTAQPTRDSQQDSKKASTAALAGIAVGAVAGLAILVAAAFWLVHRRRHQAASQNAQPGDPTFSKPELSSEEVSAYQYPMSYKIPPRGVQEMPGGYRIVSGGVQEMPVNQSYVH
jgi:hypothetical protein